MLSKIVRYTSCVISGRLGMGVLEHPQHPPWLRPWSRHVHYIKYQNVPVHFTYAVESPYTLSTTCFYSTNSPSMVMLGLSRPS